MGNMKPIMGSYMGMGRTTPLASIPLPGDAGVGCMACGRPLRLLPDSYPLVFRCDAVHFMTAQDLLEELLPMGRAPQPSAVEEWSRKARLVGALAATAFGCGHLRLAVELGEAADHLGQWARSLDNLLNSAQPAMPG